MKFWLPVLSTLLNNVFLSPSSRFVTGSLIMKRLNIGLVMYLIVVLGLFLVRPQVMKIGSKKGILTLKRSVIRKPLTPIRKQ